jgi:hypothetical protein
MKDLSGQKFNRLAIVEFDHYKGDHVAYYRCRCDCGVEKVIKGADVKRGVVKSCGCYNREMTRLRKPGLKHGYAHKERLYEVWKNMKRRCYAPNNERFQFYGGKGVIVCDEWKEDYAAFRKWAHKNGYAQGLTIDRIDNDGNYEPSNCRWATAKVQENNMSRNHILTYRGESLTIAEWADRLGVTYSTINHRVQRGWDMERLINQPPRIRA